MHESVCIMYTFLAKNTMVILIFLQKNHKNMFFAISFKRSYNKIEVLKMQSDYTNFRTFKVTNVGTMCRIWEIITFLEFLSKGGWSDTLLNNIQALLIFELTPL